MVLQKSLQTERSIIDVRWPNFILLSVIILSFYLQVFPLLNHGNLERIWIIYFKFCKFLLYLPPWTKTRLLLEIFSSRYNFEVGYSSEKTLQYSFCAQIPSPPSYPFFRSFCVCIFFSLCVFFIYSYSTIFTLCIVWVRNKLYK